ncbi:hypothetical protein BHM03_00039072 [Ensete ventricosum]|nr:hypothetical protein BHM03_00039072 [Ensete ventricosum]
MVSLYDLQFFHSSILVWFAEKHGTCSCPIIQDEYSYFSTALGLYFKNNMTGLLIAAKWRSQAFDALTVA